MPRYTRAVASLLGTLVLSAGLASSAAAQQPAGFVPPRLWDGTTPDLRGIWQVREPIDLNIEGQPGGKGIAATRSIIVDPADGKIPYRSDALARRSENLLHRTTADPSSKCLQPGVPRATYRSTPLQILQSPGQLAIVYEDSHAYRVLYPEDRPHFEGVDWWMGDSRSRWEGNTLVVDVTTLTGLTWLDAAGNHHSNALHVVERYTPTGRNTLQYEARVADPNTFTQPWTIRTTLHRNTARDARLIEDECLEDANGVRRRIAPSNPRNLLRNDLRRWKIVAQLKASSGQPAAAAAAAAPPVPTTTSTAAAPASAGAIPRLPNGRPDFRGTWYKVGGFGLTGTGVPGGGAGRPGGGGGGLLGGETGRSAAVGNEFFKRGVKIPYLPEAIEEKKWRAANQFLDGEPRCHLAGVPRAAEQPPYPHYIVQDEQSVAILYEYVHEPRIIPLNGSARPKNYWAWDGDSRGHWEGDTLVVDVRNFNGRIWLDMAGNFVSENLHVVERYTFKDADTYIYEATLTDPTVFSKPWAMRFEVRRQKDAEQILEYGCLEGEGDLQHYTAETGGMKADVDGPAQVRSADVPPETDINGCLRGDLVQSTVRYTLETEGEGTVPVFVDEALSGTLPQLIDREVRLHGTWRPGATSRRQFAVATARPLAEGCSWNGRSR